MNYPLISEYIESIMSAEDNFDKLNYLRPVLGKDGLPIMSSGNFAVVFKMEDVQSGKSYAIKCFLKEQEEREERYRQIIHELEKIKRNYFVSTQYYEKELFVDTRQDEETEFPILLMDWVEGICLEEYMRTITDDKIRREILANKFQQFVCWLLPKHFAHGDLKPDNIIVKDDGDIVLVDYDGMFVPSLYGKPSLEKGTPMFQFAERTLNDFNEYIDDYAAIIILLILKINVLKPTEFEKYNLSNTKDCIKQMEDYINDKSITPLLSAYIMVSTFGKLDRQQICCLLGERSEFDDKKELDLLMSARQGDTVAMCKLGKLFYQGKYVPKNHSKAIQWYQLAYYLGNVNAACGLCKCYQFGDIYHNGYSFYFDMLEQKNVNFACCRKGEISYIRDKDKNKAKQIFSLGSKANFSPSKNWLAYILKTEGKYETAIELYKQSANEGYAISQKRMAELYCEGKFVEKNYTKAVEWYRKAGMQGDSESIYNIGMMYYYGKGVSKDYKESVKFFKEASNLNDKKAQYMLAFCYYNGYGVEQNYLESVKWYLKAAEQGLADAQYNLATCYYEGEGVEQNYSEAIKWYLKAAEQNDPDAHYMLGLCYELGKGVPVNIIAAKGYYYRAAELGNKKAINKWKSI